MMSLLKYKSAILNFYCVFLLFSLNLKIEFNILSWCIPFYHLLVGLPMPCVCQPAQMLVEFIYFYFLRIEKSNKTFKILIHELS